ncbi:suppressor of glycerol defect [Elasticomyces elasticus]|nr:suppressor of glycerol defect [Elasticomyces elasticus]KAK3663305.1 suppressor of glycerol defect [Elasticomyces elasticus]KAK4929039.1 suppressor of glycerol defect [Elasticomyces elasticus]KAK5750359.1 suppressor of glycerol defect [Elasticomyces elasticus]
MSRSTYAGPKLPKTLLDQVGGGEKKRRGDVTRKDRRKAEREAKKGGKTVKRIDLARQRVVRQQDDSDESDEEEVQPVRAVVKKEPAKKDTRPLKSILKSVKPVEQEPTPETEIEEEEESDVDEDEDDLSSAESDDSFTVSRQSAKAGLADEDDEIAALERKLGIKGNNKSSGVDDSELDWMVTGDDGESDDDAPSLKRKRPEDDKWLRDKRRKVVLTETASLKPDVDSQPEADDLETPFSEDDELSEGDFAGFESEEDAEGDDDDPPPPKRERENPYVAPIATSTPSAAKYIPPSLRKAASSDDEALKVLRRQMQGQLNRLSDANLLTILQGIEQMYDKHARQHVTSTMVDLLVSLVSDPSVLNDTFIILHAGFAAAVYKTVGTDFGALLLEKLVESFDQHMQVLDEATTKQQLNLLSFLSNLYTFQVVGSAMVFDYIRMLLNNLSENSTELLLRVLRTAGPQLRQEDPSALKEIVLLLQRHTAEKGEANLSVRTKFMIDTIRALRDNKTLKTGVKASALASEHTTKMKKILGTLNNTRSALRATEPLRITLEDLRQGERKGKWWLVGASYQDPAKAKQDGSGTARRRLDDGEDAGYDSETPGHTNLTKAAKAQGMNTEIRRQIFVNIVGADDYQDAFLRLQSLKLKAKQMQQEVPRVLLHCVAVEEGYNPFYGLLARKLGEDNKAVRKALGFGIWETLKSLRGAEGEDGSDDEDAGASAMGLKKVVGLAKFYGFLIADGTLAIGVLKTADFAILRPDTKGFVFAEVVLTSVFLELRRKSKGKEEGGYEEVVGSVFEAAGRAPQMIEGLQYFLRTVVAKAALGNGKKEVGAVREGCRVAVEVLGRVAEGARDEGGSDSEDD